MNDLLFQDDTLILVGHGSTTNPAAREVVDALAAAFRRRAQFAEVRVGLWRHEPWVRDVLTRLRTPRAFVVPVFISEGYFTEEALPRELGFQPGTSDSPGEPRLQVRNGCRVIYCRPVGTHPSMTEVILRRARNTVSLHPGRTGSPQGTFALAVAGHGTQRNGNSRRAIEDHADRIRARGEFAEVVPLFLEEAPRIADWHQVIHADRVVVVPFFISEGSHTADDLPVLLGVAPETAQARKHRGLPAWNNPESIQGREVWYTAPVGTDPQVAEVVLERVREAAGFDGSGRPCARNPE